MDQDLANLDLSLTQPAYWHETVPAEDGYPPQKTYSTPTPSLSSTIYNTPTEFYDPTPSLSNAAYDNTAYDNTAYDNTTYDNTACDTPTEFYDPSPSLSSTAYDTPTECYDPTPSLSNTIYDTPTEFYDPTPSLSNTAYDTPTKFYDPTPSLSSTVYVAEGTFTQGFDPPNIASHGPYFHGRSQPTPAAPPSNHAVAQAPNVANATGHARAGVVCANCGTHIGRQSDLDRHMKTHDPNAQVFQCQVQGCQYSSKRKDKLKEHCERPHKSGKATNLLH